MCVTSCWVQVNCSYFSPGRYETSVGEKWETDDKHCGAPLLAGISTSVDRWKNKNPCTRTAILLKILLMNRTDRMHLYMHVESEFIRLSHSLTIAVYQWKVEESSVVHLAGCLS